MRPLLLALCLLLAGCAGEPGATTESSVVPAVAPTRSDGPDTSLDGPLYVPVSKPDHPDPKVRGGAAAGFVDCQGPIGNAGIAANFGASGGAPTPDKAVDVFLEEGLFVLPNRGYRLARKEDGRALFVYEVGGRTRVALIVAWGPGTADTHGGKGWGIESFATCDASEYAAEQDAGLPVTVWEDADGNRVPTTVVSSRQGHEHCGWQGVTFLRLRKQQFVGDPDGVIEQAPLQATFAADTDLPDDATDTGYRHDGDALWVAADGNAVYLVGDDGVQRWPAAKSMIACR